MKIKQMLIIGLVLCFAPALKATEVHNHFEQDPGIITETGVIDDDYLFLGKALNFSGEAQDLIFLGEELTFSGKTKQGLVSAAKKLVYTGTTGNGIMAAGMDIALDGPVEGNSYIGCKTFHLSNRAEVNGDLFVGSAKATLDGTLNGDLYAGAGEIIINNEINGNVVAYGGRVILGEKAMISGNLTYSAKKELSSDELARVTGTVTVKEHNFDDPGSSPGPMTGPMKALMGLFFFISFALVGCLLLFLPVFKQLDGKQPENTFWKKALWGLIPVLMYPAVILLCFALVFTAPLGGLLILAFLPLFFMAYVIGATLVGNYLVSKLKWRTTKRHYHFLMGALLVSILSLIPFINFLAFIFVTALGWSAYISFLLKKELIPAQ